ncbi:MAG: UDP-glucose/GDP-mannose dehydrogenase family protein [Acidobacteria bacterium]|nr:UDP-glucose/GDP-mannose dehydrogenase family protein [Acidobacteriota bacterium]
MHISVFGLGYVGTVSAACLARDGHSVIGVDTNPAKVDAIAAGKSPVLEPGLSDIVARAVAAGKLRATTRGDEGVLASEITLVCVGTPGGTDGRPDLRYVRHACSQIGSALATKPGFHVVGMRSTLLPGTLRSVVVPILEEASGKCVGEGFGVCSNPEFLREGTSIYDYDHPPRTVIGAMDARTGKVFERLYAHLQMPMIITEPETAEMVKFADNAWHAVKVSFANEIGSFCKSASVDSQKVMDIFVADTKLNLSASYLRPGFAFGGSCLPKDVKALLCQSRSYGLDLPLIGNVLESNRRHVERAAKLIESLGERRIGLLGLAFKPDTDDVRESPSLSLAQILIRDGYDLRIYDPNVDPEGLLGVNRDFLVEAVPQISDILVKDPSEILRFAKIVVVGRNALEFAALVQDLPRGQYGIVDLIGICRDSRTECTGICW